jgi:hypothetical protein
VGLLGHRRSEVLTEDLAARVARHSRPPPMLITMDGSRPRRIAGPTPSQICEVAALILRSLAPVRLGNSHHSRSPHILRTFSSRLRGILGGMRMHERPKIDSPVFSDKEVLYEDKEERVADHLSYVKTLLTFLRDPAIIIVFLGNAVKSRPLPLRASKELPGKRGGPGSRKSIIADPPLTLTPLQATASARALVGAACKPGTAGEALCVSGVGWAGQSLWATPCGKHAGWRFRP